MTGPGSPVAQLRRLRAVLRQEREAHGLTQKDVADALDWSTSKLIRIERGPVGISVTDLKALLLHYGVTEASRVDELVAMVRATKTPGWWQKYRDTLPSQFITLLGLEASSVRLRQFQGMLVPGLLQTRAYADAIIKTIDTDPKIIENGLAARMERQKMLGPDGPECFFIVDQSVLHRQIGDAEVMRDQLRQLIDRAGQPNITIQVVPFSAGFHAGMRGAFEIFELSEEQNDYAVDIEQPYEDTLLEEPSVETLEYVNIFMQLEKVALPPAESVQMIEQTLVQMRGAS